jgi:hypothetical protein
MVKAYKNEGKQKHTRQEDDNKKTVQDTADDQCNVFFSYHLSRRAIAREMGVRRTFVMRWTQSPDQDCSMDMRGWIKGVRRKWDPSVEATIQEIHRCLKEDSRQFYTGSHLDRPGMEDTVSWSNPSSPAHYRQDHVGSGPCGGETTNQKKGSLAVSLLSRAYRIYPSGKEGTGG